MGRDRLRSPNDRAAIVSGRRARADDRAWPRFGASGHDGRGETGTGRIPARGRSSRAGHYLGSGGERAAGGAVRAVRSKASQGGAGTAGFRPAGQVLADHHAVQSKLAAFERAGPVPQDGTRRWNGVGHSENVRNPLRFALPVRRLVASSAEDDAGAQRRPDPGQHLPRDLMANAAGRESAPGRLDLGVPSRPQRTVREPRLDPRFLERPGSAELPAL